jgi:hypothetical protein
MTARALAYRIRVPAPLARRAVLPPEAVPAGRILAFPPAARVRHYLCYLFSVTPPPPPPPIYSGVSSKPPQYVVYPGKPASFPKQHVLFPRKNASFTGEKEAFTREKSYYGNSMSAPRSCQYKPLLKAAYIGVVYGKFRRLVPRQTGQSDYHGKNLVRGAPGQGDCVGRAPGGHCGVEYLP